jgi:hypothetical protein
LAEEEKGENYKCFRILKIIMYLCDLISPTIQSTTVYPLSNEGIL